MKTRKPILFLIPAALALLAGCCENTANCTPCGTPAVRQVRKAEVNGVSVYRLGREMTANTTAVRLTANVPGGYSTTCNGPVPQWFGLQSVPAGRQAVAIDCPVKPEEPRARAVSMIAPAPGIPGQICSESTFSPIVCAPDPNMGACFTLPESREVVATPEIEIYVPNGGTLEKLADVPSTTYVAPTDVEPTAKAEPLQQNAVDEPVAEIKEEAPKVEEPVTASVEKAAPVIVETVDDMPPVFREGTTDRAMEEILSSAKHNANLDGLAPVELPPELK